MEKKLNLKLKNDINFSELSFVDWFMLVSPFLVGLYFDWLGCLCSAIFTAVLIAKYYKNRKLVLPINLTSITLLVIVLGYILSCFWAIDSYEAFFGILKFMPIVPFYLIVSQYDDEKKSGFLDSIPYSGAIMTVISLALKPWYTFRYYFYNGGRMTGLFQYANAFAIFLLVGIIILLLNRKLSVINIAALIALIAGIFLSGSRTVFVLTVLFVAAICIYKKETRKYAIPSFLVILGIVVAAALISGKTGVATRFLSTSLAQSSFLGRLLYYKDALPVIVKKPFGLGYLGYYYYQSEFQTGRYIVRYIHNDFLQFFVDTGIIPGVLFIASVIKNLISKRTPVTYKFVIAAISMHCMLDFDLQYLAIFFILITAMSFDKKKEIVIKKPWKRTFCFFSAVKALVCMYFCIALCLYTFGYSEQSYKMYDKNTEIQIEILKNSTTAQDISRAAYNILSHNKNVAMAYDAQARVAEAYGKYDSMIELKKKAVSVAKFNAFEYTDYYNLLKESIEKSEENGDVRSREVCVRAIKEIPIMIRQTLDETDPLAWKIEEKPNIELDKEKTEYINNLH